MGRHYRKRRSNNRTPNPVGIFILLAVSMLYQHWREVLLIISVIGACVLLVYCFKYKKQKSNELSDQDDELPTAPVNVASDDSLPTYTAKSSIMSNCEKEFYAAFKEIAGPRYTVQPQINLASIIDKESKNRYRNELFRNIDFGIFDERYSLVLLIEVNDQTHTQKERTSRDKKVRLICEEAGIPLITFWTKYGVNKKYIRERLHPFLPLMAEEHQISDDKNEDTPM